MGIISGTNYVSQYSGDAIDAALTAATNAAQVNGVLEGAGDGTFSPRGVDSDPTVASTNLVESGGVYGALSAQASATATALAGKVDKEAGKGLSANDYTDEEKAKLAGIEAGAQVNTVTGVKGGSESSYRTGNVNITKANIGLGNVDNTSDANKPISDATAAALANKQDVLTFDNVPTENSANPVKSGGVYDGLEELKTMILASFPTKSLPSAPIHSFSDGADGIPIKAMSVDVRAVQDLHGQSAPYPAGGGGVNKIVDFYTSTYYQQYAGVCFIKADIPAGTTITVSFVGANGFAWYNDTFFGSVRTGTFNGTRQSFTGTLAIDLTTSDWNTLFKSAAGNTASANVHDLMVEIGSSASPYQPYENICPIVGWDEAKVVGSGKNLLDPSTQTRTDWVGGNVPNWIRWEQFIPCEDGDTFYFSSTFGLTSVFVLSIHTFNAKGELLEQLGVNYVNPNGFSFTVNSVGVKFIKIGFYHSSSLASYDFTNPQLEFGSAKTDYAPYSGRIVTIDFGGTVYGGVLTYKGGKEWEFTPTHAAVDLGTLTYTYAPGGSGGGYFGTPAELSPAPKVPASNWEVQASTLCEVMQTAAYQAIYNGVVDNAVAVHSNGGLWARASAYGSDVDAFKTAMSGVKLLYELATPLDPITLTADAEVVTEYGDNVLYADCGDSELTYRQDIGLVIGGE